MDSTVVVAVEEEEAVSVMVVVVAEVWAAEESPEKETGPAMGKSFKNLANARSVA